MEKDIRQLINRYMDGQTTIDEEQKIADYLRNNPIPDDLKRYKEMFAWFDRGMPLNLNDKKDDKNKRKTLIYTIIKTSVLTAAATILALLVITWKDDKTTDNISKNITLTNQQEYITQPDTTKCDSVTNINHTKKRNLKSSIRRYIMPIPKSLIAYNTSDSIKLAYDIMLEKDLNQISKRQEEAISAIITEYNTSIGDIETTLTALEEDFTEMTNDDY